MSRPRDSQRSKVYEAEQAYFALCSSPDEARGKRLATVAIMQAYVDEIVSSRWWKSRRGVPHVEVMPRHGCRRALATQVWCSELFISSAIKMPLWSRYEFFILHELAHVLTVSSAAAHGREFCQNFLALVGRWMGKCQQQNLRTAFRDHKVKWYKAGRKSRK